MDNPLKPTFTPFVAHLGVELVRMGKGEAEICLKLEPYQENGLGVAHGGVIMTLLDSVMSRAAGQLPDAPSQTAVTVEMSSRFHRPGRGPLLAEGWVVHASRSLCSCAAQLVDEEGTLVATATGTFKYWLAKTTLD